ncbi:MAG: hypothetical protein K2I03_01335 [Lachnospiraceae bacterium]|nr:hypothetical protein [Lachnospiraceae bacterium]
MKGIHKRRVIIISIIALFLIVFCGFVNRNNIIAMDKNSMEMQKYIDKDTVVSNVEYKYIHGELFYNMIERQFYKYTGNTFSPIPQQEKEVHIIYDGIEGNMYYTYCDYENERYVEQVFKDREGDTELFPIEIQNNKAYIYVCKNPTHAGMANRYPLEFDLDTGEYKDFLESVEINGVKLRDYQYLNQWRINDNYIYVTVSLKSVDCCDLNKESEIYRIDLKDFSVQKVNENAFSVVDMNMTNGKFDIIKMGEGLFLRNLENGSDTKMNIPDTEEIEKICINDEENKLLMLDEKIYLLDLDSNNTSVFNAADEMISGIDFVNKDIVISNYDCNSQSMQIKYYMKSNTNEKRIQEGRYNGKVL